MQTQYKDDYERKQELLKQMFPGAKFTICFPLDELDGVLSYMDTIAIKMNNCYCYDDPFLVDYNETHLTSHLVLVHNKTGRGITNKEAIEAIIDYGYDPKCGHEYFERFKQIDEGVFKARFGS